LQDIAIIFLNDINKVVVVMETQYVFWQLGTESRRRWVDNIKMDLRDTGWGGVDYIDMTEDRDQWRALVNTVMNLWVP
jgi:hypothetical protein